MPDTWESEKRNLVENNDRKSLADALMRTKRSRASVVRDRNHHSKKLEESREALAKYQEQVKRLETILDNCLESKKSVVLEARGWANTARRRLDYIKALAVTSGGMTLVVAYLLFVV